MTTKQSSFGERRQKRVMIGADWDPLDLIRALRCLGNAHVRVRTPNYADFTLN